MTSEAMDHSHRAEATYRRLLLSYPSRYRLRFGDEMVGVLMEKDDAAGPRRGRPSIGESLTLIRHGLAMRLRVRGEPGTWRRPVGAAAAVLATLGAVIAVQTFVRMGIPTELVFGHPIMWVDPAWPVALLSILVFALFVLGRQAPAAIAALAASGIAIWQHRQVFAGIGNWGGLPVGPATPFDYEQASFATSAAQELALLVPGLVLALLLLRPGAVARSFEVFSRTALVRALAVGTLVALWTYYGMSMVWAVWIAGLMLIPAMLRTGVLLRAGALIAFAFGYLFLSGQADGSGSKMPNHGWALAAWMGLLPLAVLLVAILLISQLESSQGVRQRISDQLDSLALAIRGPATNGPAANGSSDSSPV
jgi:hypothetical protein